MEAIKETVHNVIKSLEIKSRRSSKDNPQRLLKRAFTKKELGHVEFNYLKKGILGLKVDSSPWLYSLSLQKEGILAKLRKKSAEIKEVRFYLGEIR